MDLKIQLSGSFEIFGHPCPDIQGLAVVQIMYLSCSSGLESKKYRDHQHRLIRVISIMKANRKRETLAYNTILLVHERKINGPCKDDNDFFTTLFLGLVLLGGFLMILLEHPEYLVLLVNLISKQHR